MISTEFKSNITMTRLNKLYQVDVKSLPLADAIKVVRGDGSRVIYTFEDPNCGYCKKLAVDLAKINNVTVYTFVVAVLGPDSMSKSKAIWCAKNKAQAWASAMSTGFNDTALQCDASAIDRNGVLFKKLNLNGTPTIVFANGDRVPGYIPAAELERRLSTK